LSITVEQANYIVDELHEFVSGTLDMGDKDNPRGLTSHRLERRIAPALLLEQIACPILVQMRWKRVPKRLDYVTRLFGPKYLYGMEPNRQQS
jgi:hypothetical protein